ncbi:hypothetical protein PLICRDRAFT_596109 [Plicaturopsis crispa FD-325 SS-3]|nr:hypothetical protein PLICRDRAFT_596109 [Plicaturopsis crispa FD-325 SS-3]
MFRSRKTRSAQKSRKKSNVPRAKSPPPCQSELTTEEDDALLAAMVDPVSRALILQQAAPESGVKPWTDEYEQALRSLLFPPAQRKSRVQLYFDVVRAQADAAGIDKASRGEYLRELMDKFVEAGGAVGDV